MNLKNLSPQVRSLVEAVTEPAVEEKYEIVDAEEDGDTVTVTFSRDLAYAETDDGDENDDR